MRFSLLITLLFFSFFSCQSMSRNSKSTNSAPKKTVTTKTSAQKVAVVKQPATNSALGKKSIYEELTGKKGMSSKQAPARILEMARDAKWKRDYVTALKRYNTLIVRYPKSKEVRQAYLDKADLYREMGLSQQSKYNMEKAKK